MSDRGLRQREIRVVFLPSGRAAVVRRGTRLLEAATREGLIIETPCGGAGKCGKCLVRVVSGASRPTALEKSLLGPDRVRQGFRLACQTRVIRPIEVEIPEASLFHAQHRILTSHRDESLNVRPRVTKRCVELSRPDRTDVRPDAERLQDAAGSARTDIRALRDLPAMLRRCKFRVSATSADGTVIHVEPGDTTGACCGLAFDIGTTTLVGVLLDLRTGNELAVASVVNPQVSYGDDVVSRIKKCRDEPDGLGALHSSVLRAVNSLTRDMLRRAGIGPDSVYQAVFAGNSTMQHLLCGIDPSALGEIPFVPAFQDALRMLASDLGLAINPRASALVMPQIGGFLGGDTVAGIVATRLDSFAEPALLVDIGTNGELVLAHKGKLTATSVAAGPAFEGARIIHGMRAAAGAIEEVSLADGDIRTGVIGDAAPVGLCGTGLVDAVAVLLEAGIADSTGRMLDRGELPGDMSPALLKRVQTGRGKPCFELAEKRGPDGASAPLCLYQEDIRQLQLANAAIRAGTGILLNMAGLKPNDLSAILLAGAFGNFMRPSNARRIGMLPPLPLERVLFVGNAAALGAKSVLLSSDEEEYARRVARETTRVDLSLVPGFQTEFAEAMLFPEA